MRNPSPPRREARWSTATRWSPPVGAAPAVLALVLVLLLLAPRSPVARDPVVARAFLDPSSAPVEELMLLPGIGERRARMIDQHRREHGAFEAPAELLEVRGIGPRTLRLMEPWLRFPPESTPREEPPR